MDEFRIFAYDAEGILVKKYTSVGEAARDVAPDSSGAISLISKVINSKKTAYGYRWKGIKRSATSPKEKAEVDIHEYVERETKTGKSIDAKIHANTADKESILEEFIDELGINRSQWFIKESRISRWAVAARDRDQDLKWKIEEIDGKPVQLMEGHSKRQGWTKTYNYSISVSFVPNPNKDIYEAIETVFGGKIKPLKPFQIIKDPQRGTGVLCEMAPFDVHFGKSALKAEIGYREYNLSIARENLLRVVNWNLNKAANEKPEQIVLIVGQDLMHVENMLNETTRGRNHLDVDTRLPNIFAVTYDAVLEAVYMCRGLAPLEIKFIPGNHDYVSSFALCFALHERFINDPHVHVDIRDLHGAQPRKAMLWGNLLVGWTHQIIRRQEAWVNELASYFRPLWGQCKFAEWHFGDQHKKKEQRTMPVMTSGGVTLRQLTALSPIDLWHYENLYTDAVPGGEMFLWSKDEGVYANYTKWIGEADR